MDWLKRLGGVIALVLIVALAVAYGAMNGGEAGAQASRNAAVEAPQPAAEAAAETAEEAVAARASRPSRVDLAAEAPQAPEEPGEGDGAQAQEEAGEALVWQVGGFPGQPAGLGTLFWHAAGQEPVKLSDVPDEGGGTRVFPCGGDAFSRDGTYLMAYIGGQRGGLYRVPLDAPGEAELERWGDAVALACNGRGRAGFSPDGTRWAYIDYEADAVSSAFPDGVLRVFNAADGSEEVTFDSVVAFELLDSGLYFAQFFTNAQGFADEAVLTWWDGAGMRELTALTPSEDCDWRSASLAAVPEGEGVAFSLGEHCAGGSLWRLVTVTAGGAVTEHVYTQSGGAYLPTAYTNQVYTLSNGEHLLATMPHGRLGNLANLVLVSLETNNVTLVTPEVIVDAFPDGHAMHLQFSPDGEAVAYVSVTANGEYTLHRLTLDGSMEPLSISAGPRGDGISTFFFTPGGDLLYVAGGLDGGDNSLWALPAGSDEPRRVTRGRFLRDAGLATEEVALLLDYVAPDDDHRDPAANLVTVTLENGSRAVLLDGRAAQAWAYPLAWR